MDKQFFHEISFSSLTFPDYLPQFFIKVIKPFDLRSKEMKVGK